MPDETPQGTPDGTGTGSGKSNGNGGDGGAEGTPDTYEELKAAIANERERRQAAERDAKRSKDLEKQLNELRSKNMSEQEKAVEEARRAGRTEAETALNGRLVAANVRAAAAGRLADPEDAIRFIDLDEFRVDDNGNVDMKAVAAAVDRLLKDKPYLAGGGGRPHAGGADQGARGTTGPSTMNDLIRSAIRR